MIRVTSVIMLLLIGWVLGAPSAGAGTAKDEAPNIHVNQKVSRGRTSYPVAYLVLKVNKSTWIEVYGREEQRMYYNEAPAGVTLRFDETHAPYDVFLGNVNTVKIRVNGRAVNIPDADRHGRTARLTLGTSTLSKDASGKGVSSAHAASRAATRDWTGAARIERVLPAGWYLPTLGTNQDFYRGKLFEMDDELVDVHGAWHPLVIMVDPGYGIHWKQGDRLRVLINGCDDQDLVENVARHEQACGFYARLDQLQFSATDPGHLSPAPPVQPAVAAQPAPPLAVSQGAATPPPRNEGVITVIDSDARCGDLLSNEARDNSSASVFSGYTGIDEKARELREEACATATNVYTSIAITGGGSYAVTARGAIQTAKSWRPGDHVQEYWPANRGYCASVDDHVLDDLTRNSWLCASY